MQGPPPRPPKLPFRILKLFCHADLYKYIEGDLWEMYEKAFYEHGRRSATLQLALEVFKLFRISLLRSFPTESNYITFFNMLNHIFLISLRNYKRFKGSFIINITGLATGLAGALLIYLWVNDELKVDQFHQNKDRLYQVLEHHDQAYGIKTTETTAGPMAAALLDDYAEVQQVASRGTLDEEIVISANEKNIRSIASFVSDSYFELFSFPILKGNKSELFPDRNSIVLSERLATKLFGNSDVLGEVVEYQNRIKFQVTGVFEDIGPHSMESFDFALPYEQFEEMFPGSRDWGNTGTEVYALLNNSAVVTDLNQKLENYIQTKTEGEYEFRTTFLKQYSSKYLYGRYENGNLVGGRIQYVRLFSIAAVFILLIACINFMNLATARASRRVKEVGVKKAMGSTRTALVYQFLTESVILSLLSLGVAILLVWLCLPHFNEITGKSIETVLDLQSLLMLLLVSIGTGLIAGSYPAFYLSKFDPTTIFRGKLKKASGEVWLRKGLVVFQFGVSIVLIVSIFVISDQIKYIQSKNIGFDRAGILSFPREGRLLENEPFQTFKTEAEALAGVKNVSSIRHNLAGHVWGAGGLSWPGKDPDDMTEFEVIPINYGMIEMLGFTIKEGRNFSPEYGLDWKNLILNEAAIEHMALEDPVGTNIQGWGFDDRQIIGVVEDFHFESLHKKIKPAVFTIWPARTDRVMVKIDLSNQRQSIDHLEKVYASVNPGFSLDFKFLDDTYQSQYVAERRASELANYFAILAILISCLGLFGLASFTLERRTKEIGIRKTLGSGSVRIFQMLCQDFSGMILIAVIIGLPVSFAFTSSWLENFAFRISLSWQHFALPALIILVIAFLAIGFQILKAANINPVDSLKDE